MSSFGFFTGLAVTAGCVIAVFLITWGVARRVGRWAVVDVTWGLSFAVAALVSLGWAQGRGADPLRQAVVTAMVCLWGFRLAGFIAVRSRGKGEDPRYEALMAKAPGSPAAHALKAVFLPQALIAFVVSLPVQVAMYERAPTGPLTWIGLAVWAVGLFFEAVGDAQMAAFRKDDSKKGQVMDRGLWHFTRHPNYFGDTCIWVGVWLVAAQQWPGLIVFFSPLLMFYFLYFQSGKALLERMMARSKPGYADYIERTSGFFPLPPKRRAGARS